MPELICSADDPRWLDERRRGVTATDISVILGISAWESPYSLYYRKRGEIPDVPDSDRFRLGRYLESFIAERWCDAHSIPAAHREGARSVLYRSTERPWQMATLDRVFYDEPVECKSWADMDRDHWQDGPPPTVRAQGLWQMDVMGVARGHVAVVFLPSGEFRHYTIEHPPEHLTRPPGQDDCDVCEDQEQMCSMGARFLQRLTDHEPPDLDGSAATLAAVRARFLPAEGPAADIDDSLWLDFTEAKARVKRAETDMRETEAKIREIAGTATRLKVSGQITGRRVIVDAQVKAHTRHQDYIRILSQKDTSNDD